MRGVLASLLGMLERSATHMAVATDHVIESFRNDLWPGYKTGAGIDPALLAQFHPLEEALAAMGVPVWAMKELEADDGLGAARARRDPRVERVFICTPDKDLAQCVVGDRVVQWDRRRDEVRDERGVVAKFGVGPASIPDYLALVGDSADGFPGVPGWGAKSTATVLALPASGADPRPPPALGRHGPWRQTAGRVTAGQPPGRVSVSRPCNVARRRGALRQCGRTGVAGCDGRLRGAGRNAGRNRTVEARGASSKLPVRARRPMNRVAPMNSPLSPGSTPRSVP